MDSKLISKLFLLPEPNHAPEPFLKAFKGLSPRLMGNAVPWHLTVPEKAYRAVKNDSELYERELETLDISYLDTIYYPTEKLFDYFQPAKINIEKYNEYSKIDKTGHVESFKPNENGFTNVVEYDRVSSITGRLKTISGPRILNLSKSYRNVLESRWGNDGAIVSLDFISLEPRILLSVCGGQPIERDPYTAIKDNIFSSYENVTRATVKSIVLSEIYGAGFDLIKENNPNIDNLFSIVKEIRDYFGLEQFKEKLYKEWLSNGKLFINNLYGRRIKTENTHTLINHYIQSSGVDVALQGFLNIFKYLEEIEKLDIVIPLYILHDAIILDVHKNAFTLLNTLCKIGSIDILKLENQSFYMSINKGFTEQ